MRDLVVNDRRCAHPGATIAAQRALAQRVLYEELLAGALPAVVVKPAQGSSGGTFGVALEQRPQPRIVAVL